MAIDYSDGAPVEAEILEILSRSAAFGAEDAPGVERYDGSWPVTYHLSPERANLLRHFDFTGLDVLELGAGMGAISRFLSERAARLEVVEGTDERYAALSQRLRDRKNWTGQVGNIAEIGFKRKHDVVCVIGVLEYSELYVTAPEGHTPFSWFLTRAREAMKEDGVLLLAIENRVGMKYWNGAAEDHTGLLYDGVCGYGPKKTARTFSLEELRRLLAGVGFGAIEEYFPFPDYKVPSTVMSRRFLETEPQVAAALATTRAFENYGQPRVRQFPEALAMEGLASAGLLGAMANSFLLAASPDKNSKTLARLTRATREDGEIAWHYSCRRRLPTRTAFVEKDGEVRTLKEPLRRGDARAARFAEGNLAVHWTSQEGPLAPGTTVRQEFIRRAYYRDAEGCKKLLNEFLAHSFANWTEGKALDAIVTNAMVPYELFDQEWRLEGTFEKSWFVLRNVLSLLADRELFPREAPFRSGAELYETLCREHGLTPRLAADIGLEARLQALVTDRPSVSFHRGCLETVVNKTIQGTLHPRPPSNEEKAFLGLLQTRPMKALHRVISRFRPS